jgi:DNA-binding NarL/FixJ family response regulator
MVGTLPNSSLDGVVDTEADACEQLAYDHIDVAIVDINLRRGSGFGVLRYMKHLPSEPQSIVYTNDDLPPYRRAAFALGASHFMDKNRDFERLAELMTRLARAKAGSAH